MSGNNGKFMGDFHQSSLPELHPVNSIGNQQLWGADGKQMAAIEYFPNARTQSLDVSLSFGNGITEIPLDTGGFK